MFLRRWFNITKLRNRSTIGIDLEGEVLDDKQLVKGIYGSVKKIRERVDSNSEFHHLKNLKNLLSTVVGGIALYEWTEERTRGLTEKNNNEEDNGRNFAEEEVGSDKCKSEKNGDGDDEDFGGVFLLRFIAAEGM